MKFKTTGTYLLIALLAVGAILTVGLRFLPSEAIYPVERMARAFQRGVVSRIVGGWRGARAEAENRRLRRTVASLAMLQVEVERLEAENARLRSALGYVSSVPSGYVAATVLSHGGAAGIRQLLRVDKGSLDGVRPGAVVTVSEGLVGQVTEVAPHSALVTLITDPSLKVAAKVELTDGSAIFGILSGGDADSLRLRHLRNAENVPPRSRVLTSGLGGIFPPGLVIGTLLEIRQDENGRLQEGEVQPPVDYSTLEDVFICREN